MFAGAGFGRNAGALAIGANGDAARLAGGISDGRSSFGRVSD